jgi:hypothetical protein
MKLRAARLDKTNIGDSWRMVRDVAGARRNGTFRKNRGLEPTS